MLNFLIFKNLTFPKVKKKKELIKEKKIIKYPQ